MSGGAFNYLINKVGTSEMLDALDDLQAAEEYAREQGYHEAADEIYAFRLEIETCKRRLRIRGERLEWLLRQVEWSASGDVGPDAIDQAYKALLGDD